MKISILTLFPEVFETYFSTSIPGRAAEKGLIDVEVIDIRTYSKDKHRKADDEPFGGGAGMVMMAQPLFDCIEDVKKRHPEQTKVVYMSPCGKTLNNRIARSMASEDGLIILCGHYEGIDQRVIDQLVDEEISIGDYVLTGGELAAMVVCDSVMRFIPGVLGGAGSESDESFEDGLLEYPQYTRPSVFRGLEVPDVILSGNHALINRWRRKESLRKTMQNRPDLLERAELTREDRVLLQELSEETCCEDS